MALGATHIRFAKDLKEKYGISDMRSYISGTLYPDSRYVTEVERTVTHPRELDDSFFESSDFNRGWLVHLICDNVQYQITKEWISEAFEGAKGQGSETWVNATALKILQDIDDIKKFDLSDYLPFLNYVEMPNGEPREKVGEFNQIYMDTYANPASIGIAQLCELWRRLGIGDELVQAIKAKSHEYAVNAEIMNIVPKIYPEMLRRAK